MVKGMRSECKRYLLYLSYRHWAGLALIPSLPHIALIFAYSVKRGSSKYCSIFVIPFCSYGRRHEIRVREIFIVSLLQALGLSHSDPLITSHSFNISRRVSRAIIRVAVFLRAGVGSLVRHSGEAAEFVGP